MPQLPLEPMRQAVSSGEFCRAHLLWQECAAGLLEELSNQTLSAARLKEVGELVEWSRTVALCSRAHLQDQLNGLHVAREYAFAVPSPDRRIVVASF
jgi:hypothetical protein